MALPPCLLGGIIVHAVTKEGTRKLEFHECLRPAKKRAVRGIAALEVNHDQERCRFVPEAAKPVCSKKRAVHIGTGQPKATPLPSAGAAKSQTH